MLQKLALAAALAVSAASAVAAEFYVVVPVKNRTSPVTVTLNSVALPAARAGTPYAFDFKPLLSVMNDPAFTSTQVSWSVSGSLPAPMVLNADGTLTGTPLAPGAQSFALSARYKARTATQNYNLEVLSGGGGVALQAGGYRTWADGTVADSCKGYLTPGAGYSYTGATGNGIYQVNISGSPVKVYCDMTTDGGGWMLTLHAVASVTSAAYDLTLGQSIIKGMALKTVTQDSVNYPVLPNNLTNNFSQVMFKGGTSAWVSKLGAWVRFSTVNSVASLTVNLTGVKTASGHPNLSLTDRIWDSASPASANAPLGLWDTPDVRVISNICGGDYTPGGKNCPLFRQDSRAGYPYHYDTSSSRQLFVR